jgi:hypothetical protein
MAWIESHQELARHPKTKKLARLLSISLPSAVGHLHFFWWWAMDYAQDGDISRFDEMDIADACGWDGDAGVMYKSLIDSNFVDLTDDGVFIHDWDDYAGRLIEKRKANTERKRMSRGRHAAVTQDNQGSHGATVPNRTVPNRTKPSTFKTSSSAKVFADGSQELELSTLLKNLILQNNPKAKPPNLQKWAKQIDLMLRVDKRTPEEIEQVIRLSQQDTFWRQNILSTEKLREKFDQLYLKMQTERQKVVPLVPPAADMPHEEYLDDAQKSLRLIRERRAMLNADTS